MKAIINGKIILKDQIIHNSALLFTDVITGIVPEDNLPTNVEIIDANGGYVSPGLIDLHIHGYNGKDTCDATEESIRAIAEGLVKNGVTGFLPTTMTVDMNIIKKTLEVCRALKEDSKTWIGSEILGCHAEGPFISEMKKGAQDAKYILKPDAEFVKEYSDIIKIITLAPEVDNAFSVIDDYDTALKSIKAGVKHITHLFNAMTTFTHRTPGIVGAALNSDVSVELIVDTFHVDKSLCDIIWNLKKRKLCFITDCLSAGGLSNCEHILGGKKIIYKDNLCYLEDGTIAGSVLELNKGVWNAYTHSKIPLNECVNCASLNPATVIGVADRKGSIEIGKDADIIITNEKFEVQKTIIRGNLMYQA